MRAGGVICEFNPFHSGHAYLLSRMREQIGSEGCVVCLMSGRFVQRGEVAMADPYLRSQAALAEGADLVVELPFPWSAGSAEHFALAGIRILTDLGVGELFFGSECGDLSSLTAAATAVLSPTFQELYPHLCRKGHGTAAAFSQALQTVCPQNLPTGFPSSNDLLGIAYLAAIEQVASQGGEPPIPYAIPRLGAGYRETALTPHVPPSATALRILFHRIAQGEASIEELPTESIPPAALNLFLQALHRGDLPLSNHRLLPFYHTLYRMSRTAPLEGLAEWGGGLASHICRHARVEATPEGFLDSLRTKQYTDARIRRALLFGATGVTDKDLRQPPAYTTLLAASSRGRAYLRALCRRKKTASGGLTLVTKPADAPEGRQKDLAEGGDALFTLCYPTPRAAGDGFRRSPYMAP